MSTDEEREALAREAIARAKELARAVRRPTAAARRTALAIALTAIAPSQDESAEVAPVPVVQPARGRPA